MRDLTDWLAVLNYTLLAAVCGLGAWFIVVRLLF